MIKVSTGNSASKYFFWNKRPTFEYHIHCNVNVQKGKFLYEKINGSVGWNKNSAEQH